MGAILQNFGCIFKRFIALKTEIQAQSFSDRAQSEKYQECLVQVEENSAAAILGARKWYIEGGAVAAQHCEALALYDQKRYGEAASLFEAIVGKLAREEGAGDFARQNKDVLTVQLNYLAGLAWHSDENYDKAYNALNSAIVGLDVGSEYGYELYNSEMIDAYLYRAETFRKINEHLKARLDLNAALVLKPSHPDVLFESGVNYRMLNNDEKALQEWEKLIAKYPNSHWQNLVQENISLIGQ